MSNNRFKPRLTPEILEKIGFYTHAQIPEVSYSFIPGGSRQIDLVRDAKNQPAFKHQTMGDLAPRRKHIVVIDPTLPYLAFYKSNSALFCFLKEFYMDLVRAGFQVEVMLDRRLPVKPLETINDIPSIFHADIYMTSIEELKADTDETVVPVNDLEFLGTIRNRELYLHFAHHHPLLMQQYLQTDDNTLFFAVPDQVFLDVKFPPTYFPMLTLHLRNETLPGIYLDCYPHDDLQRQILNLKKEHPELKQLSIEPPDSKSLTQLVKFAEELKLEITEVHLNADYVPNAEPTSHAFGQLHTLIRRGTIVYDKSYPHIQSRTSKLKVIGEGQDLKFDAEYNYPACESLSIELSESNIVPFFRQVQNGRLPSLQELSITLNPTTKLKEVYETFGNAFPAPTRLRALTVNLPRYNLSSIPYIIKFIEACASTLEYLNCHFGYEYCISLVPPQDIINNESTVPFPKLNTLIVSVSGDGIRFIPESLIRHAPALKSIKIYDCDVVRFNRKYSPSLAEKYQETHPQLTECLVQPVRSLKTEYESENYAEKDAKHQEKEQNLERLTLSPAHVYEKYSLMFATEKEITEVKIPNGGMLTQLKDFGILGIESKISLSDYSRFLIRKKDKISLETLHLLYLMGTYYYQSLDAQSLQPYLNVESLNINVKSIDDNAILSTLFVLPKLHTLTIKAQRLVTTYVETSPGRFISNFTMNKNIKHNFSRSLHLDIDNFDSEIGLVCLLESLFKTGTFHSITLEGHTNFPLQVIDLMIQDALRRNLVRFVCNDKLISTCREHKQTPSVFPVSSSASRTHSKQNSKTHDTPKRETKSFEIPAPTSEPKTSSEKTRPAIPKKETISNDTLLRHTELESHAKNNERKYIVKKFFRPSSKGNHRASKYRLSILTKLEMTEHKVAMTYEPPTDLKACDIQFCKNEDYEAQYEKRKDVKNTYFADFTETYTQEPRELPSFLSEDAIEAMVECKDLTVKYSPKRHQYYAWLANPEHKEKAVSLRYILRSQSQPLPNAWFLPNTEFLKHLRFIIHDNGRVALACKTKWRKEFEAFNRASPIKKVLALAARCRQFGASDADLSLLTQLQQLSLFSQNKWGRCSQRTLVFIALATLFGIECHEIGNQCHSRVQVIVNGIHYDVELGGFSAKVEFERQEKKQADFDKSVKTPAPAPRLQSTTTEKKEHKHKGQVNTSAPTTEPLRTTSKDEKHKRPTASPAVLPERKIIPHPFDDYCTELFKKAERQPENKRNVLIQFDSIGDPAKNKILKFYAGLNKHVEQQGKRLFFIDDFADIQLQTVDVRDGKLDFNPHPVTTAEAGDVIFMNWSYSKTHQAGYTDTMEEKRRLANFPIRPGVIVIWVLDKAKQLDPYFYTYPPKPLRFTYDNSVPLPALNYQHVTSEPATDPAQTLKLELYDEYNEQEVEGGFEKIKGQYVKKAGKLSESKDKKHIVVVHPPAPGVDRKWDVKVAALSQHHQVTRYSPDYKLDGDYLAEALDHENPQNWDYVLNAETCEEFHTLCRTAHGEINPACKGWLAESHNRIMTVLLTGSLRESQWAKLLAEAKQERITLRFIVAKENSLPPKMLMQIAQKQASEKKHAKTVLTTVAPVPCVKLTDTTDLSKEKVALIYTKDVDATTASLAKKGESVITVTRNSEFSEFMEHFEIKTDEKNQRSYDCRPGTIYERLQAGETVYIKGEFSPQFAAHMETVFAPSPYLTINGQKHPLERGRLVLIADEHTGKHFSAPCRTYLSSLPAPIPRNIETELAAMQKKQEEDKVDSLEKRLDAIVTALRNPHSPWLTLFGPAGSGKSTVILLELQRHLLQSKEQSHLAVGMDQLEKWFKDAKEHPNDLCFLFIDEANLKRSGEYDRFKGLKDTPRGIMINGIHTRLSPNQKIIFAGNPPSYKNRQQHDFLSNGAIMWFGQWSEAAMRDQFILPALALLLPDSSDAQKIVLCNVFLAMYHEMNRQNKLISLRDLNDMCLQARLLKDELKTVFNGDAKVLGDFVAKDVMGLHDEKTKATLAKLNHAAITAAKLEMKLTPSRCAAIRQLNNQLAIRDLRMSVPEQKEAKVSLANMGKREVYLHGNIDSSTIENYLRAQGFSEDSSQDKCFIHLSPSQDDFLERMHEAFHNGHVVIINKGNSNPYEEQCNAYSTGVDPEGKKATREGFMAISLGNGYADISEARKNRSVMIKWEDFTDNELRQLLGAKNIPQYQAEELIKEYKSEQHNLFAEADRLEKNNQTVSELKSFIVNHGLFKSTPAQVKAANKVMTTLQGAPVTLQDEDYQSLCEGELEKIVSTRMEELHMRAQARIGQKISF